MKERDMIMQGYLHKMKRKTLFGGSWNKRFFKVEPSLNKTAFQFNYYTNSKSPNPQQSCDVSHISDVRQFRDGNDESYCFRVETPSRSLVLRAHSEIEMDAWIDRLNEVISYAKNGGSPQTLAEGRSSSHETQRSLGANNPKNDGASSSKQAEHDTSTSTPLRVNQTMHNTVRSAPTIPVRAPSSIANSAPTSTPTHSKHHDHNYTAERSTRESPEKNNTTNTTSARDHHSIPPRPQRSSTETKSDHGRLAIVSGRDSSRTLMTNYPQTDSQDIQTVISPDNEKDTTARTSPNKGKNDYDDDDDKNETASHNVDNEVDSHDKPAPQSQNKSNDLSDFRKSVLSMPEVNFASSTSKDDETFPSPSSSPKQSKAAPPAVAVVQTRTRRLGGQIENKIQQKRSIMNDSISDWDADDDDIDDKDDDGEEEINATSNHQHSTSRGMPSVFNNESSVHGIALAEEGSDWDESEEEQVGTTGAKRSMEARATNLSISNDHRSNGHDSESDVGELNISDFVQNTGGDLHLSSGSESDSDTEDTNRGGGLRSTGHRRLGGARTTSNDSSWLY